MSNQVLMEDQTSSSEFFAMEIKREKSIEPSSEPSCNAELQEEYDPKFNEEGSIKHHPLGDHVKNETDDGSLDEDENKMDEVVINGSQEASFLLETVGREKDGLETDPTSNPNLDVIQICSDQAVDTNNLHTSLCSYTVKDLKNLTFSKLSLQQKLHIKNIGRPKPDIAEMQPCFPNEIYENYDWICGCSAAKRLFCFPCLLFAALDGAEKGCWVDSGFNDLAKLYYVAKIHECSQEHIKSQLELKLLGQSNVPDYHTDRSKIQRHHERVKRNRDILSKIIDCIKCCGALNLPLYLTNGETSVNATLKGLIEFTAELEATIKEDTIFQGLSRTLKGELLDSILQVCQDNIKKELAGASFVSMIIDDISDVSDQFQTAIGLRYVLPDGTPVERFWGFMDPNSDTKSIAMRIGETLSQVLDAPDKLISQSYDGSRHHEKIRELIQQDYRFAYPVHYHAHNLNFILSQAASQNQEVRVFFSNLSDIFDFFESSSHRKGDLEKILRKSIPENKIEMVFEHREAIVHYTNNCENATRQTATINRASAVRRMLEDSVFNFWLNVFRCLMPHAHILSYLLHKACTTPAELANAVTYFEKSVQQQKESVQMKTELLAVVTDSVGKKRNATDAYITRIRAAKGVCDTFVAEVKERFAYTSHLSAAFLFSSSNFDHFEKIFPLHALNETVEAYPFLDKDRLRIELEIIYKRPEFREISEAQHFLKFIIKNDLRKIFPASYALLQIIVTTPIMSGKDKSEKNLSILKRIKTVLRDPVREERLTAWAMLSIEKQMIKEIINFNDLVIDKFSLLEGRETDFSFKLYEFLKF